MIAKCDHCYKRRKMYEWKLEACADEKPVRQGKLCAPCDATLNRIVLEYFNVPNAARLMKAYEDG